MLRKLFKIFLIPLQIAMIFFLIAAGAFLWRLHHGPININKLTPYLVQIAATSDTPMDISIKTAELQWGGLKHLIDFSVRDFKAFDNEKKLIASIPQLSFSFSLAALLRGTIAPKTLVIYRPYLHLTLDKQGEIKQEVDENKSSIALETLLKTLKREKHLTEFSLIKAQIKISDALHNAIWNISDANLTYSRRFHRNKLDGSVKIALDQNRYQSLSLKGRWTRKNKKIPFVIKTENLELAQLPAAQKYPFLKNFTTPVSLKLETQLDILPLKQASLAYLRNAVNQIKFTLSGSRGMINLPDPVIARYDLKRFAVTGSIHNSADGFDISRFDLVMQSGATAQGNLTVSGIGSIIDTGSWEKIQATLNAKAQNVPMAMLPSYWPASLGPDVHTWVKQNLRGGMIDNADFVLHFKGLQNETGITPDMVDGIINVTETQVAYLDNMPTVDKVSGQVHLTLNDLIVTIEKAVSHNVAAQKGGTFSILGMTDPVTTAALNINAAGKVPDILEILDFPALQLMSAIGIDPKKTTGTAHGNLQLKFPLGDAFKSPDQIYVKVDADVRNADVEDIVLGLGLQDAILKVKMDGKKLSLNGTALFYGATAKYTLDQTFDPKINPMTDIKLSVNLNDRARDRLNYPFFTAPAVSGVMPTDLSLILKHNRTGVLNITADLTKTAINLYEIGWNKPEKAPGKAAFTLNLADGKPTEAPLISLTDDQGTQINGKLTFTKQGMLKQIAVPYVKTTRTDARISADFSEDRNISIDLSGKELDISALLNNGTSLNTHPDPDAKKATDPFHIKLNVSIDKLWLSEKGYSEKNTISAHYYDGWKNMRFNSFVGVKKVPLSLLLKPTSKEKIYTLSVSSEDAGYTLRALDYTSTVKGGHLELNGTYTAGIGTKGTLTISDFYLENDQMLIKILQMTSFTGIIDTLRGEGLFFDTADIPFTTDYESLTLESALVSGSSLGITLNGKYYWQTGYMNLYGSIIPFYTANSFLGKIPLIGGLFSGEKGGGLIAPTYTIKGKLPSPDISVNGFSALAPGAFRSVFGKITREEGDLSKKEASKKTAVDTAKNTEFKPLDSSLEKEIADEELQREPAERILDP
ncbi:MAG: AsmA-like C-terminal domain-containing protein [Alphaproteobacteria bacterium]|nr:AsmA-like C-terminal domain-containing protein [Alphaproteobacteria bacterium]